MRQLEGRQGELRDPQATISGHMSDGQPSSDGFRPNSDGLQPTSDGLQPSSDGLQRTRFVLYVFQRP